MRILLITALTCLFCNSCNYSSDETFYVEVDFDILPNIEVLSNLNSSDTIDKMDSIFFRYEIVLDTGGIFFSQIFFNEGFVFYSEEMADSLWINPVDTLSSGSYELYMEVLYKSATGSLADLIDAEYLLKDTTWQVVIDEEEVVK